MNKLLYLLLIYCSTAFSQNSWKAVTESPSDSSFSAPLIWQHKEKLYFLSDKISSEHFSGLNVSGTALTALSSEKAPPVRTDAAQWEDADHLWLWGGISEEQGLMQDDFWAYDISAQTWISYKVKGPEARIGAATWTDNEGRLWMFGGQTIKGNITDELWSFDINNTQWTKHKSAPSGRANMAVWSLVSGKVVIYGGFGLNAENRAAELSDLWEFEPKTLQWTSLNSESVAKRRFGTHKTPAHPGYRVKPICWKDQEGYLWLTMGQSVINPTLISVDSYLWRLNPKDLSWTYVAVSPEKYITHAASVWQDKNGFFYMLFPTYVNRQTTQFTASLLLQLTP